MRVRVSVRSEGGRRATSLSNYPIRTVRNPYLNRDPSVSVCVCVRARVRLHLRLRLRSRSCARVCNFSKTHARDTSRMSVVLNAKMITYLSSAFPIS
jgi:hypothetical protein